MKQNLIIKGPVQQTSDPKFPPSQVDTNQLEFNVPEEILETIKLMTISPDFQVIMPIDDPPSSMQALASSEEIIPH